MDDLEAKVREWIAGDSDPDTRAELKDLLACRTCDDPQACDRAQGDLEDRFGSYLTFGTAGLRGALGAGPNRMNTTVVAHATAAVARFVNRFEKRATTMRPDGSEPSTDSVSLMPTRTVVVGYDARPKSAEFAQVAADVLAGAGIRALMTSTEVPTPVLAFAVRHLGADAGIMITASHNPRGDNGYKVYLGGTHDGRQLVAPYDAEIHAYMVESLETTPTRDLRRGAPSQLDASVIDAYVALTAALVPEPIHQPLTVYTAMHGVGSALLRRVLNAAGFDASTMLRVVESQDAPDGEFPTLPYPNPEENGALDRAFELGRETGAQLVLAHDPDADRLGVAIPDPVSQGGFRRLTGNEVGVLLGAWAAERASRNGVPSGTFAASIVSSPQLERIATHFGFDFTWTLSGFKWISRVPFLLYGYEEALGYLVNPDTVNDKDGISAALAVLSIASELHAEGKTIADRLSEIDEQFGTFVSGAFSVRSSRKRIASAMHGLRASTPTRLAGIAVSHVEDLSAPVQGDRSSGGMLPTADVLALWLEDGSRVMFRPSGTEAKLKVYLDVCEETAAPEQRRTIAMNRLFSLTAAAEALVN